ncbi:hypothetical protein ABIC65_003761 [Sphingomonas trueperi]|uniref:right-handed parallel beta-helix repeat-containing protein n=1 Tax=Sphingomonas trueperi TaxID=53317 RepID=UPI003390F9B9
MFAFLAYLAAAVPAPAAALQAQVLTVATPAELANAIAQAKSGSIIKLAPGNYGQLTLNDRVFTAAVTITSENPSRPALFTRVNLNRSVNVTFSKVEISTVLGADDFMVRVVDGSNITFDNVYIHGLIDGAVKKDGSAISVARSNGFTLSTSRVFEIAVGIRVRQSKNVVIRDNDISMIGIDAVEIPGTNGVQIARNKISKFRTTDPYHPDSVQCWTTGETSGCKNVKIVDNQFLGDFNTTSIAYPYPQGVFFGDEIGVGGYENIEVTGNLFVCPNWHAITIGRARGTIIRNNRISACAGVTPWIRVNDPTIVIQGNIAPSYYINSDKPSRPAGNDIGSAAPK